jgi:hypothetical protein
MLAPLLAAVLGLVEGPVVGTNLAAIGPGSTQWPFADFLLAAEGWSAVGGAIEVDSDGNLLSLAEGATAERTVFAGMGGLHPVGPFTLTWTGSGKFEFAGPGKLSEETPGRIVFDADPGDGLRIRVSNVDPKDPPRAVRFVAPGSDAGPDVAHHVFLQKLGLYRVLRFADWTKAATSPIVRWEDRVRPGQASYAGASSVPWETCFAVAGAQRAGAWINVPFAADDAYVDALAGLARAHVASGLPLYVEYATEPWDAATPAGEHCIEQAKALGPDARRSAMRYAAERSVAVFQAFEKALGGRNGLVRVLAVPFGDVEAATDLLAWKSVGRNVDALAVPAWTPRSKGPGRPASRRWQPSPVGTGLTFWPRPGASDWRTTLPTRH